MRWLDNITNAGDVNWGKPREMEGDREACVLQSMASQRLGQHRGTGQQRSLSAD